MLEAVLPRIGNAWARRLFQSARRSGDLVSQDRTQKLRSFGSRRIMYAGPVLAGVLALLISHFLSSSIMVLGTNIAATFIAVMGVDVIFGYTGQLSIGQSGFMMVGAYVAALLAVKSGVPFLLTLLAATASGAALGVIFGLPVARLRGIYLAVLTWVRAQRPQAAELLHQPHRRRQRHHHRNSIMDRVRSRSHGTYLYVPRHRCSFGHVHRDDGDALPDGGARGVPFGIATPQRPR